MKRALGVDVGGVIIDTSDGGIENPFFGEDGFVQARVHYFAFSVLKDLNVLFHGQVYVVSKCHSRMERKICAWMEVHDFSRRTGIPFDHIYFCKERNEKAPLCLNLEISDFVDDHLDVLHYLHSVPYKYLFQGHPDDIEEYQNLLPFVHHVHNWLELGQQLHRSF
ncbi:hypothetical protein HZA98_00990 [Candidatus Woesearchaeota archaeon]|nr:hypothetical protein [Candidatus Woesearchaeota archaeon]